MRGPHFSVFHPDTADRLLSLARCFADWTIGHLAAVAVYHPTVARLGRGFGLLLTAFGISNVGDGIMQAAFPLLVAGLTRDPLLVAAATLANRLPWFLFAITSGALVDRMNRRRVLVATDTIRTFLVAVLAAAVFTDTVTLPLVYAIAFALGVAETFFDTSAEAFVPALVPTQDLPAANGRLQGVEWVGGAFAGPPIGAALFAFAAGVPFGVNAASFAVAAVLVSVIPGQFHRPPKKNTSLRTDMWEGIRWLWRQRVLRTLSIMAGTTNMLGYGVIAVFVLFAQDILGVGDVWYGVLLSAMGVGGLAGAIVASRVVKALGPGRTVQGTVILGALLSGTMGLISNPWIAGFVLMLYGVQITLWNVVAVSLRQTLTPDVLRGRVAGVSRLLTWGTQPIGAALGGVVASLLGLRAPFFLGAIGFGLLFASTAAIVNNRTIEAVKQEALGIT